MSHELVPGPATYIATRGARVMRWRYALCTVALFAFAGETRSDYLSTSDRSKQLSNHLHAQALDPQFCPTCQSNCANANHGCILSCPEGQQGQSCVDQCNSILKECYRQCNDMGC